MGLDADDQDKVLKIKIEENKMKVANIFFKLPG